MKVVWKHFLRGKYREALIHVQQGGIAIHDSGMKWAGKKTAHLLAPSVDSLYNAARTIGLSKKYLQMTPKPHFDLFGSKLELALYICEQGKRLMAEAEIEEN